MQILFRLCNPRSSHRFLPQSSLLRMNTFAYKIDAASYLPSVLLILSFIRDALTATPGLHGAAHLSRSLWEDSSSSLLVLCSLFDYSVVSYATKKKTISKQNPVSNRQPQALQRLTCQSDTTAPVFSTSAECWDVQTHWTEDEAPRKIWIILRQLARSVTWFTPILLVVTSSFGEWELHN